MQPWRCLRAAHNAKRLLIVVTYSTARITLCPGRYSNVTFQVRQTGILRDIFSLQTNAQSISDLCREQLTHGSSILCSSTHSYQYANHAPRPRLWIITDRNYLLLLLVAASTEAFELAAFGLAHPAIARLHPNVRGVGLVGCEREATDAQPSVANHVVHHPSHKQKKSLLPPTLPICLTGWMDGGLSTASTTVVLPTNPARSGFFVVFTQT